MTIHFNADEIFEIAERIEKNGANFYRAAAKKFEGTGNEQTLLNLASMEEEHRMIFATMRSKIGDNKKTTPLLDPDNETKKYLQAIADGHVFNFGSDSAMALSGKESLPEILHKAIGLEKDSIIFYLGMRGMVPENMGSDKIEKIISEERTHIVMLAGFLKGLR